MAEPTRYRFSADAYQRMGEAGIIPPDARVELIEGEVIEKPPMGFRHAGRVLRLTNHLVSSYYPRALVLAQCPIRLSDHSEPEPDLALLRPRQDEYTQGLARPEDVLLLVEVSDSTLSYDRGVKLALYAANGIPEVWVVNVGASQLEVYREPTGQGYGSRTDYPDGTAVAPLAFPDEPVAW